MDKFNIFIHFPTKNIENEIKSRNDLENYLSEVEIQLYRADCEKGSNLFYDSTNTEKFIDQINLIDELGNFEYQNVESLLYSDYLTNADNIQDNQKYENSDNTKYCLWNFYSEISDDFPPILKEIAERKLQNEHEKYLLLNINNAFVYNRNFIPVLKDSLKNSTQQLPQFSHIYFVTNFFELEKWFKENRTPRNYNFDDNRHIENHPKSLVNSKDKSPIIGGEKGKQHIASLLEDAIGDTNDKDYLINFDEKNGQYVRFEYENENPQNQYHGYHLVLQGTYDRDEKEVCKISEKILQIIDYRKKMSV